MEFLDMVINPYAKVNDIEAGLEIHSRWKDLHILNREWICRGKWFQIPLRKVQAFVLQFWPLRCIPSML
jgi:hypothetical protein